MSKSPERVLQSQIDRAHQMFVSCCVSYWHEIYTHGRARDDYWPLVYGQGARKYRIAWETLDSILREWRNEQ